MSLTKRQIGIIVGSLVFVLAMDASGSVARADGFVDWLIETTWKVKPDDPLNALFATRPVVPPISPVVYVPAYQQLMAGPPPSAWVTERYSPGSYRNFYNHTTGQSTHVYTGSPRLDETDLYFARPAPRPTSLEQALSGKLDAWPSSEREE